MNKGIDLTTGSIPKLILKVAIPAMVLSIFNALYGIIDIFYIGRVGEIGIDESAAISGVAAASLFMWIAFSFSLLIVVGTGARVAQSFGAKQIGSINQYASTGFFISAGIGIVYGLTSYMFAPHLLNVFDLSDDAIKHGTSYIQIVSMAFPFLFIMEICGVSFNSVGKTKSTLIVSSIGITTNIVLDPILILNFEMGVAGAALATLIANITAATIWVILLISKFRPFKVKLKFFSFSKAKEVIKMSWTPSLSNMAFASISLFMAYTTAKFGDDALSAQKIAFQVESLSYRAAGAFSIALAAFVGQNYGAKLLDRATNGLKTVMKMMFMYSIILSIIFVIFAPNIIGLFLKHGPAFDMASSLLRMLGFVLSFQIFEISIQGLFNGLGKPIYVAVPAAISKFLRIPLLIILPIFMGVDGVWWTIIISTVMSGILAMIMLISKYNLALHRKIT